MTAQSGKDLLVKIDMDNAGSFVTLAGLRASRISFNSETIDTTSLESTGGWRELLDGGGVRSASISGSGVFCDDVTDARARELFFNAAVTDYQVIIPDFGTIEGAFQITNIEYSGKYDGEAVYEISLASSGALTFAAL